MGRGGKSGTQQHGVGFEFCGCSSHPDWAVFVVEVFLEFLGNQDPTVPMCESYIST